MPSVSPGAASGLSASGAAAGAAAASCAPSGPASSAGGAVAAVAGPPASGAVRGGPVGEGRRGDGLGAVEPVVRGRSSGAPAPSTSVPLRPRTGTSPERGSSAVGRDVVVGSRNSVVAGEDGAESIGPSGSAISGRRRRRTAGSGMRMPGSFTMSPRMTSTTGPCPVGRGISPCTTADTVETGSPAS